MSLWNRKLLFLWLSTIKVPVCIWRNFGFQLIQWWSITVENNCFIYVYVQLELRKNYIEKLRNRKTWLYYSFPSNGPHCNEKWLKTWASSEDNNALIFCIGGSCFSCLFVVFELLLKERMKGKHFLHIHHQHAIVLRYNTIEKPRLNSNFTKRLQLYCILTNEFYFLLTLFD